MAALGSALKISQKLCVRLGLPTRGSPWQILRRTRQSYSRLRIFSTGIVLSQASGVNIPDSEWKKKLTSEQFRVCRQQGTEPPWSGEYVDYKAEGTYQCVCCGADLFSSNSKFDSGTGWPSFYDSIRDTSDDGQSSQLSVSQNHDSSHGMIRTEVLCRKCDSHLGHLFEDGPPPTGLRYCINSISLKFKPADKEQ